MPVITVNDQQYALHPGQNRLGAGADADVRVDGDAALGVQAIVEVSAAAHPVIRRVSTDAAVRVNGVALIDPTPLMHGDKVEIGESELLYSDDAKAGVTQVVSASEIAAIAATPPAAMRGAATAGGRLVSLFDGKDYNVPSEGITIGREASCAIVVAENEVSRRHAMVVPVNGGYEIRDFSANGVLVNGNRIEGSRMLATSDLIRIGSEEFRFHAAAQLAETRHTPAIRDAIPAAEPVTEEKRAPLAVLQITNSGPTNGQEYAIGVPLAHVGRGAHNDVAINDESVSDSHAKLQCRDGNWFITDLDSTNGTYVAGERLKGERMLHGVVDLRFGGVKMAFRPAAAPVESLKGTRAIASIDRSKLRPTTSVAAQDAATTPSALPQQGISAWVWGVVVLALVAAAAFFLLNR